MNSATVHQEVERMRNGYISEIATWDPEKMKSISMFDECAECGHDYRKRTHFTLYRSGKTVRCDKHNETGDESFAPFLVVAST